MKHILVWWIAWFDGACVHWLCYLRESGWNEPFIKHLLFLFSTVIFKHFWKCLEDRVLFFLLIMILFQKCLTVVSEKCIGECSRKIAPCSSFFLPVLFLIYSIYLLSIYLLQWVLWVRILCKVLWETNKLALLALKEFVCLHSWDFAVRLVCSRLLLILKAFPYSTWEIFPTELWGQSAQDVVLWRQKLLSF